MKTSEKYSLPIFEDTDVSDLKKYSEDMATALEEAFEENAYDDTDVKQSISDIQVEQTEQNTNTQHNKTDIANLANNQLTGTAEGDNIYIDDAYSGGTAKMTLLGKSEQETRSGKNKLKLTDIEETTVNEITFSVSNQQLVLNGTGTSGKYTWVIFTKNGTYCRSGTDHANDIITWADGNIATGIVKTSKKVFSGTASYEPTIALFDETGQNVTSSLTSDTNIVAVGVYLGNAQTYTNYIIGIQLEEGTVATDYEPYGAMPSPDYPSKIQNIEGDVEVGVVGKNIADVQKLYEQMEAFNGNCSEVEEDGKACIKFANSSFRGENGFRGLPNIYKENTQYTIRGLFRIVDTSLTSGYSVFIDVYYTDGTKSSSSVKASGINWREIRIVTDDNKTVSYIAFTYGTSTFWLLDKESFNIIEGDTTAYEPYQSQTANFTFTEGQKLMEGGYLASDGVRNVRGDTIIPSTVGAYNPAEDWFYISRSTFENSNIISGSLLSNHFTEYSYTDFRGDSKPEGMCYNGSTHVLFRIAGYTTSDEYKTFFANNNVAFEYPLAEPVTTAYTAEQQKQWDNMQSLQLFDGVNNISSPATMQLTYVKSTASVINNLQDQINEIKQAIVSIGGV